MRTRSFFRNIQSSCDKANAEPNSWIVIADLDLLGSQQIFVASKSSRKYLTDTYNIPDNHVVSMLRSPPAFRHDIPEEPLSGQNGLALFRERLAKINDKQGDVLIHCQQGQNRSPVAAVIYLVDKGIDYTKACELVENAFREQRDPNFTLNKRGHYTEVLNEISAVTPSKTPVLR